MYLVMNKYICKMPTLVPDIIESASYRVRLIFTSVHTSIYHVLCLSSFNTAWLLIDFSLSTGNTPCCRQKKNHVLLYWLGQCESSHIGYALNITLHGSISRDCPSQMESWLISAKYRQFSVFMNGLFMAIHIFLLPL